MASTQSPTAQASLPVPPPPASEAAYAAQRRAAVQHAVHSLAGALQHGPAHQPALQKPTAGVSYVLPTESRQVGADGLAPLPHLVIQPPGLVELPESHPTVAALLHTLTCASTTAGILPLMNDNAMKTYLLDPVGRLALLKAQGGHTHLVKCSLADVGSLLADRQFLCLHYRCVAAENGPLQLAPCTEELPLATADGSGAAPGSQIERSDVQIGMLVRKAVGGTCPLKAVAARLEEAGVLDALLGIDQHSTTMSCTSRAGAPQPAPPSPAPAGPGTSDAGEAAAVMNAMIDLLAADGGNTSPDATADAGAKAADAGSPDAAPAAATVPAAAAVLDASQDLGSLAAGLEAGKEPGAALPKPHHGLPLFTLGVRLELYCSQAKWDSLTWCVLGLKVVFFLFAATVCTIVCRSATDACPLPGQEAL